MDTFQTVLSGLAEQIRGQEGRWLQLTLLEALWKVGEPATDENLPEYLPRLQLRSYPDGTIIMALDAQEPTESQRGRRGRVLFGFGEASLKRQPDDSWVWVRPLLDERRALAYELDRPARSFENFTEAPHPRASPLPATPAGPVVDLINHLVTDFERSRPRRPQQLHPPLLIHQPQFKPGDFDDLRRMLL